MRSLAAQSSRLCRPQTWTAGRRRSVSSRRGPAPFLQERLVLPSLCQPLSCVQGRRLFASSPTQALWKTPVNQSVSQANGKGKAKEGGSGEEAKIGLTLQVSQQDLADFGSAGELLKGERPSFGCFFCLASVFTKSLAILSSNSSDAESTRQFPRGTS